MCSDDHCMLCHMDDMDPAMDIVNEAFIVRHH